MKPTAKYKAGNIEADKNTGMQFQAMVYNPDDRPIMFVQGESREMVRMAVAATIAAFNKVLGS